MIYHSSYKTVTRSIKKILKIIIVLVWKTWLILACSMIVLYLIISSMHIAIIDDERILSHGIQKKLRAHDYDVSIMNSCKEFREAKLWKVDLYLVDITLWDGSGFDIVEELRNDPERKDCPILIMSWHGDIQYKLNGFEIWADDYIVKPFNPDELVVRVRKRIQDKKYHSSVPGVLKYKNIVFDRLKRTVEKDGINILLSKKEKNILEHFIIRLGELVEKNELAENFWNNDNPYNIIDNTINVTICNLRKKLGDNFDLQTISGEWYILKP